MNITLRAGEFYGETQTHRTLPDFRLIVASYPSGARLPKHSHQCASFSLMLDGAMIESYDRRTLESHKLTVGFNAADEPHSNSISPRGARFLILELGPDQTRRAQRSGSSRRTRRASRRLFRLRTALGAALASHLIHSRYSRMRTNRGNYASFARTSSAISQGIGHSPLSPWTSRFTGGSLPSCTSWIARRNSWRAATIGASVPARCSCVRSWIGPAPFRD